jgi:aspartyl-tRNA(Asn)/glutamyl-tRNA(Gln) amidotransferase subunit A
VLREAVVGDAISVADEVREGRRRAVDVAAEALGRIERLNPSVNAFVHVRNRDDILADARAVDDTVRSGEDAGPLAGVPIGVKDLEDVEGVPTSHGSLLGSPVPAGADSTNVSRLRAAGAIVIGKTNTPEFGYSIDTRNRRFGRTLNPLDPSRTPGGSSGGSAAVVASGMVPLATGSDGGGSIRIPAAFCRLPALKATAGRIPTEGDSWSDFTHVGILSRTVRDIARYLDVASGPSAGDRRSLPRAPGSFEAGLLEPLALSKLRAVASEDLCGAEVAPEVRDAFRSSVAALEASGMSASWAAHPLPDAGDAFNVLAAHRDAIFVSEMPEEDRSRLSRGFLAWCAQGQELSLRRIADAEAMREELFGAVEEILARVDLIVSPTVGVLPWRVEDRPATDPMRFMLTHPFNMSGHPAVTVPARRGLVGLQAAGPRFDEVLLLRFAEAAMTVLAD